MNSIKWIIYKHIHFIQVPLWSSESTIIWAHAWTTRILWFRTSVGCWTNFWIRPANHFNELPNFQQKQQVGTRIKKGRIQSLCSLNCFAHPSTQHQTLDSCEKWRNVRIVIVHIHKTRVTYVAYFLLKLLLHRTLDRWIVQTLQPLNNNHDVLNMWLSFWKKNN
jgi:hypothetical protein